MRKAIRSATALFAVAGLVGALSAAPVAGAAESALTNMRGSASKLGTVDRSSVSLSGVFALNTSLDLRNVTVTLEAFLDEEGGRGELVGGGFPMVLTAQPGAKPRTARFGTPAGAKPRIRVDIPTDRTQPGSFSLVGQLATIALPHLCPPTRGGTTRLTTRIVIDDGVQDPITVEGAANWQCIGRDPQLPLSLLLR